MYLILRMSKLFNCLVSRFQGVRFHLSLGLSILLLSSLSLAFVWPWEVQQNQKKEEAKPAAVAQKIASVSNTKTIAPTGEAKQAKTSVKTQASAAAKKSDPKPNVPKNNLSGTENPKTASTPPAGGPKPSNLTQFQEIQKTASALNALRPNLPDPSIMKVQQKLQDIIRLNESIKPGYRTQSSELQHIYEQAAIHQRILDQLGSGRSTRAVSVPPNTDELLRQEKIKMIRNEASESFKRLQQISTTEKPNIQESAT